MTSLEIIGATLGAVAILATVLLFLDIAHKT
jgi:hypothetical protein